MVSTHLAIVLVFSLFWSSEDPFRVQEGEQRIFVSALNLREYPDDDAYKIGSFPTGTRFVYDLEEEHIKRRDRGMELFIKHFDSLWD